MKAKAQVILEKLYDEKILNKLSLTEAERASGVAAAKAHGSISIPRIKLLYGR